MNPYVFIVGGTRSGTTLLQRMVEPPRPRRHPRDSFGSRFYEERIGLTPGGMVTTELVASCSTIVGSASWASHGRTWKA